MKMFFEKSRNVEFSHYKSLQIGPTHVHRSKAEHKHAIFILGQEMASVMAYDEFSGPGRTQVRMQERAIRAVDDPF